METETKKPKKAPVRELPQEKQYRPLTEEERSIAFQKHKFRVNAVPVITILDASSWETKCSECGDKAPVYIAHLVIPDEIVERCKTCLCRIASEKDWKIVTTPTSIQKYWTRNGPNPKLVVAARKKIAAKKAQASGT